MLLLQVLMFGITLWLGLYLPVRDAHKPGLRFAGLGLVTYALGLAVVTLSVHTSWMTAPSVQWRLAPILLPSVFWAAATWYLLPEATPTPRLGGNVGIGLLAALLLLLLAMAFSPAVVQGTVIGAPVLFLLVALVKSWQLMRGPTPRRPVVTLLAVTLFFLLGAVLLIAPPAWLAGEAVLLALSLDLLLLGAVVGVLDAHEEGTTLLPDALRSLAAAGVSAVLFGGQVGLVIAASDAESPFLVLLLLTVTATAIGLEVFSGTLQSVLDQAVFVGRPQLQGERQRLRAVNTALARLDDAPDWPEMDEATFVRLTRRALSHFNDLDKLAASPLIHLPLVTLRLQQQQEADTVLARAHVLKALLAESIQQLKPADDKAFDSMDAWRYYNVLYFPYVQGLKPYSVRMAERDLDGPTQEALTWFRTHVPERTLYNWQTAAARLVAQHLRETQEGIAAETTSHAER